MAFTELELQRCKKVLAQFLERRRPPAHIRDRLDIDYRITGQSVEIFEIRPDWQDKSRKRETLVAKATFVRIQNRWKVFWMRKDLKWHGYEPNPEMHSLEAFLDVVGRDEYCCFFG
ncbi:DUF3024 domain-containing protein [Thermithiobacillus plumbiphilus]|uniref:DUF3024 domain-containing protein n=1 Tax=Thermithiobacillus plumbiphilus TaxID=1729899 RepID=A0ABU9D8N7_9PROT